jgi:hypothetical protein
MLMHHKRYVVAAGAAVTAATLAVTGVAASASVARPGLALASAAAHKAPLPKITITMSDCSDG